MTKISLVIQSRGTLHLLKHMLSCYRAQTHYDRELILVIDEKYTDQEFHNWYQDLGIQSTDNAIIIRDTTGNFPHKNVSAMRNLGIQKATGAYINLMDDDEDFPADYFEKSLSLWNHYHHNLKTEIILTPTLMYRHTGTIQNQGFWDFNYWLSKPTPCILGKHEYARIQIYSGNSLFAPAKIFKQTPMDERFDFVYEDLDYSHTLYKKGYPIIVDRDLKIYHMEREKTKLEDAWIGSVYQAYRKAKHRIIFVNNHATAFQRIQFYLLGFRGQPLWLIAKVLLLAKKKDILPLLLSIWQGTRDGIKNK